MGDGDFSLYPATSGVLPVLFVGGAVHTHTLFFKISNNRNKFIYFIHIRFFVIEKDILDLLQYHVLEFLDIPEIYLEKLKNF